MDFYKKFSINTSTAALILLLSFQAFSTGSIAQQSNTGTSSNRPYGIEVEFASTNTLIGDPAQIDPARYQIPLDYVRRAMNDPDGAIEMVPWEKKPESGAKMAIYKDPQGRVWSVTPESVNTGRLDGFEFVGPPIRGADDSARFDSIVHAIQTDGQYGKGVRSSIHATFEVANLIKPNGDANDLVNTILAIESHWPETYGALSPKRYGTVINRFSVPLAADQPELLQKLAAMPRSKRTFANVKALFEKYYAKELEIKGAKTDAARAENMAFKYRAANYKKLFGLGGMKQIPVIEFRIPDYMTSDELRPRINYLQQLLDKAPGIGQAEGFQNPFAELKRSERTDLLKLSRVVNNVSDNQYNTFLNRLGADPSTLPKYGRLGGPLTYMITPATEKQIQQELDLSHPVLMGDGEVTAGFEAEFRGSRASTIVDKDKHPLHDFLSPSTKVEGSGNIEVRSNPTNLLDEQLQNMKKVKGLLASDLKGFHFHFRIPKSGIQIPDEDLDAWLARVGDSIFGWRTENRSAFISLSTWSNVRPNPDSLSSRATIRVQKAVSGDPDKVDIEIRGYMGDVDKIKEVVRKILIGVQHPELIRGFAASQKALLEQDKNVVDTMQEFSRQFYSRDLRPDEIELLKYVSGNSTNKLFLQLPLMGFEEAPYLTPIERTKIHDANFDFKRRVMRLLENALVEKTLDVGQKNLAMRDRAALRFRNYVQTWAKEVHYHDLVNRTLFLDPKASFTATMKPNETLYYLYTNKANPLTKDRKKELSQGLKAFLQKSDFDAILDQELTKPNLQKYKKEYFEWLKRLYPISDRPLPRTTASWAFETEDSDLRAQVYKKYGTTPDGLARISEALAAHPDVAIREASFQEYLSHLQMPRDQALLSPIENAVIESVRHYANMGTLDTAAAKGFNNRFNNLALLSKELGPGNEAFLARTRDAMKEIVQSTSTNPYRERAAQYVLAESNTHNEEFARSLLRDSNAQIRERAHEALDTRGVLNDMFDSDPAKRSAARTLLEHMHPEDAVKLYIQNIAGATIRTEIKDEWTSYLAHQSLDGVSNSELKKLGEQVVAHLNVPESEAGQELLLHILKAFVKSVPSQETDLRQFLVSSQEKLELPHVRDRTNAILHEAARPDWIFSSENLIRTTAYGKFTQNAEETAQLAQSIAERASSTAVGDTIKEFAAHLQLPRDHAALAHLENLFLEGIHPAITQEEFAYGERIQYSGKLDNLIALETGLDGRDAEFSSKVGALYRAIIQGSRQGPLRLAAAQAILERKDPEDLEFSRAVLTQDHNSTIRAQAHSALDTRGILNGMFDPDPAKRAAARTVLDQMHRDDYMKEFDGKFSREDIPTEIKNEWASYLAHHSLDGASKPELKRLGAEVVAHLNVPENATGQELLLNILKAIIKVTAEDTYSLRQFLSDSRQQLELPQLRDRVQAILSPIIQSLPAPAARAWSDNIQLPDFVRADALAVAGPPPPEDAHAETPVVEGADHVSPAHATEVQAENHARAEEGDLRAEAQAEERQAEAEIAAHHPEQAEHLHEQASQHHQAELAAEAVADQNEANRLHEEAQEDHAAAEAARAAHHPEQATHLNAEAAAEERGAHAAAEAHHQAEVEDEALHRAEGAHARAHAEEAAAHIADQANEPDQAASLEEQARMDHHDEVVAEAQAAAAESEVMHQGGVADHAAAEAVHAGHSSEEAVRLNARALEEEYAGQAAAAEERRLAAEAINVEVGPSHTHPGQDSTIPVAAESENTARAPAAAPPGRIRCLLNRVRGVFRSGT